MPEPVGGNQAFGASVTYSTAPNASFPAGDDRYMDGSLSDWSSASAGQFFTKGHFPQEGGNIGWNSGSPVSLTFDYGEAREADFFYAKGYWGSSSIVRPTAIRLEYSDDNSAWTDIDNLTGLTAGGAPGAARGWIVQFTTTGESHQYWRLTLTWSGTWVFLAAVEHGSPIISQMGVHTVSPAASGSYPIIPYSRLFDTASDWEATSGSHALVGQRNLVTDSFTGMVGVSNTGSTTTHTLDNISAVPAAALYLMGYGGDNLIEEPTSIIVQHSDDNSSWTTFETRGSLGDQGQPGAHHWVAIFELAGESHRYWRVQLLHGGEWIHLAAFELWPALVDRAIGAVVAVTPTTDGNFPINAVAYKRTWPGETTWTTGSSKLTDGAINYSQAFGTGVGWAAASNGIASIDLGTARLGSHIAFHGIHGNGSNMRTPTTITLAWSDDNSSWTTIWTDASLTATGGSSGDRWVAVADVSGEGSHRYWRISLNNASNFFVLSQIEFWSEIAAPATGEGIGAIDWDGEATGEESFDGGGATGAITWAGVATGEIPPPPVVPTGLTVPWVEVWTRPGDAAYGKRIADLPILQTSVQVPYSGVGRGSMTIPANFERIDEIMNIVTSDSSQSVWSTIKVVDDTGWLYEWLPGPRVPAGGKNDTGVEFAGDGLESIWGFAQVEPWDWDGSANFASTFPDWIWGGNNLLTNPGFEDSGISPIIDEIWVTDATGGTFTIDDGTNTTDPIAWDASPSVVEAEIEAAGIYDDCLVGGSGTVDDPWTVEAVDPFQGVTLTVDGSALTNGGDEAVHIRRIQFGSLQPTGWSKSITVSDGTPRTFGAFDSFRVSSEEVHSGIYALRMDPAEIETAALRYAGAQQVVSVKPGGIYQASLWIYSTSSTDTYRFVIRGIDGDFIKSSTGGLSSFTLTANTWTQVTITDVPVGTNSAVIFRIATTNDVGTNPSVFYIDDAEFNEGMVPTTIGCMLEAFYDDATTDHAPGRIVWENEDTGPPIYLTLDFDCDLDSNGDPWDRDDVTQTFTPRMSYLQVIDQIVEEGGYQWRLVPDDWQAGTYLLQVYNPEAMGVIADAAIIGGTRDTARSARFFAPSSTAQVAEGDQNMSARVENSGLVATFGRIEGSILDQNWTTFGSLSSAAIMLNTEQLKGAEGLVYTLDSPVQRPLVAYRPGDRIYVSDPPIIPGPGPGDDPRQVRRVAQIQLSISKGQPDQFVVHISDATPFRFVGGAGVKLSRGLIGQAATDNAVAALLAAYKAPRRVPLPSTRVFGGGGQPTITIAASDASDISKGKADLVCDGSLDDQMIQQGFDMLPSRGGKIVLTEGIYNFGPTGVILPSRDFHLHGMGRDSTICRSDVAADFMFLDGTTSSQFREQRISDIAFDGDALGETSFTTISTLGSGNNVYLSNCDFHDFTVAGVNTPRPVGGWAYRHCHFYDNGGPGIISSETFLTVIDCIFDANTAAGISTTFTGGNHFVNNIFNTNSGPGIAIGNAISGGAEQCIIMGNRFSTNTGYGIEIQHGGDHMISGNIFAGNTTGSMTFGAGGFGVSVDSFITGNTQVGAGTFTNYAAGSSAFESNNVVNGTLVP